MYIYNETTRQKMSIKERMLAEVAKSIDVAYALCNIFSRFRVDMEVHANINTNPNFKSNDALKRSHGLHNGNWFCLLKQKPDAFGKLCCANKKWYNKIKNVKNKTMSKLKINGKELRAIGLPEGLVISVAMTVMEGITNIIQKEAFEILKAIMNAPENYLNDEVLKPLQKTNARA